LSVRRARWFSLEPDPRAGGRRGRRRRCRHGAGWRDRVRVAPGDCGSRRMV